MRASRLRKYDPLDRWLASVTMKTAPGIFLQSPLPDDQAMCELFMSMHKACFLRFWPGHGNSCLICVSGCLRDHPYPRSRSLPLAHENDQQHASCSLCGLTRRRRCATMGPSTTAAPISVLPATSRFHRQARWGNDRYFR